MKKILLSVHAQYCELIFRGKKTIEARKNYPLQVNPPFEVLVYQTKRVITLKEFQESNRIYCAKLLRAQGKVIGSFICDRIDEIEPDLEYYSDGYDIDDDRLAETCLTREQLREYGKGVTLYGWHITEPKLFDKPKEFYELYAPCKKNKQTAGENCKGCAYAYKGVTTGKIYCDNALTRPPQSFCYVEEY